MKLIKHYYGDQVIVNLLSHKEGERILSQAFQVPNTFPSFFPTVPQALSIYPGPLVCPLLPSV